MFQEPFFFPQTAAKSRKRSVFSDDPVTGDDNGNPVFADRRAGRPCGLWIPCLFRDGPVTCCFAERDPFKLPPDRFLKTGPRIFQGQIEVGQIA